MTAIEQQIGDRKIMTCACTNKLVVMEFTGSESEDGEANGHKGWLCLHHEDPELDGIE